MCTCIQNHAIIHFLAGSNWRIVEWKCMKIRSVLWCLELPQLHTLRGTMMHSVLQTSLARKENCWSSFLCCNLRANGHTAILDRIRLVRHRTTWHPTLITSSFNILWIKNKRICQRSIRCKAIKFPPASQIATVTFQPESRSVLSL